MGAMTKTQKFFTSPSGKIVGLTTLLFASLLGYYFYAVHSGSVDLKTASTLPSIAQEDHTRGAVGAKVTIVEYGDFQCPACGAYEPTVRGLLAKYPQDVRVTFRHFPLVQIHRNAYLAASYAEAAGSLGKFWEMHDALYDNQKDWSEGLEAETKILGYAKNMGLDTEKLKALSASKEVEDRVAADYKEASALRLPGTPSFFVNGKSVESKDLESEVAKIITGNTTPQTETNQ